MRRILFISFLFFCITAEAQKLLKGVVLDAEKNKPIAGASVFLNNTSIGTIAKDDGKFELFIPAGKFDLVVSSVGYEISFNGSVVATEQPDFLTIKLSTKSEELETVVVESFDKIGWAEWSWFFIKNFIGTSNFANDCKIQNPKVIRMKMSDSRILTAYSTAPLIIENKALGYRIHYQLESFEANLRTYYLSFTGYPFFEEMEGNERQQRKWQRNRKEAYYGSVMHFMRAVYRNKIADEGFEIKAIKRIPNKEKIRVKALRDSLRNNRTPGGILIASAREKDSLEYYNSIMHQRDYFEEAGTEVLPGDSIAFAVNNTTAGLEFEDFLVITFKNKTAPTGYTQETKQVTMKSRIRLVNRRPLEIQANGNYYYPTDMVSTGYWSWSERIAMLLPYDYQPPKD